MKRLECKLKETGGKQMVSDDSGFVWIWFFMPFFSSYAPERNP